MLKMLVAIFCTLLLNVLLNSFLYFFMCAFNLPYSLIVSLKLCYGVSIYLPQICLIVFYGGAGRMYFLLALVVTRSKTSEQTSCTVLKI